MAYRNYFVYNGKQYYTGTIFIASEHDKQIDAIFICYNIDTENYIYKVKNKTIDGCKCIAHEKYFYDHLVSVTDKVDNTIHMPVVKQFKDSQIDGLFLGWVWYIFLMIISVIFKNAIGLWILWSVVFFSWRHNKIKKEGNYIEW